MKSVFRTREMILASRLNGKGAVLSEFIGEGNFVGTSSPDSADHANVVLFNCKKKAKGGEGPKGF